jgi:hypothetical protein
MARARWRLRSCSAEPVAPADGGRGIGFLEFTVSQRGRRCGAASLGPGPVAAGVTQRWECMPESSQRIAIVVAVIGVIGTLGAALIGNWDKIVAPSPQRPPKIDSPQNTRSEPRPPAETVPNIGGVWRDSDSPSNGSQITQDGDRFHFTRWGVLPNGTRFRVVRQRDDYWATLHKYLQRKVPIRRYIRGRLFRHSVSGWKAPGREL